jgi:hypothetical protein
LPISSFKHVNKDFDYLKPKKIKVTFKLSNIKDASIEYSPSGSPVKLPNFREMEESNTIQVISPTKTRPQSPPM